MNEWNEDAACASGKHDPDLWFPEDAEHRDAARFICQSCPVLAECREWALTEWPETPGDFVIGGMSRNQLSRARNAEGIKAPKRLGAYEFLSGTDLPCRSINCEEPQMTDGLCSRCYDKRFPLPQVRGRKKVRAF